jgi:hypothetical protein
MDLCALLGLGIRILLTNSCTRWRGILKGPITGGGWAKLAENLFDSPFKRELSNDNQF